MQHAKIYSVSIEIHSNGPYANREKAKLSTCFHEFQKEAYKYHIFN